MATTVPANNLQSSSSSDTVAAPERDAEAQRPLKPRASYFQIVFDQAGVDDAVLNHKYAGEGTTESPFIVDFLPDDPHNPQTFPKWKKWFLTTLVALATLAVAFVSTAFSGGLIEIMEDFDVVEEIAIIGISLFVVGFAVGPLLWAPLSEFFGRQILFFTTYAAVTAFNAGACGAKNIHTLIILRFFAGAFGSSPLTNSGGVIADMFSARDRGLAAAFFAAQVFLGPSLGPIAGGFLGAAAGWRWIEGLMAVFTGVLWIICTLFVPETYAPVLLRRRANKLSKITGKTYVSKMDLHNRKTMAQQFRTALSRPWVLLFREPIVFLSSIYIAIVYGTLYMLFAAFPIVFYQGRHWSIGISGLAFVGVAVGMFAGVGYAVWDDRRYTALLDKNKGVAPPEARLPPGIVASVLLPIGLFWFAWTNGPSVHWVVPLIGAAFFSAGLILVFLSLLNYLIDSYVVFAASVLAANTVLRSLIGAAFPLFTTYMYNNLGNHWASSIPAFLALACMPFPYLFWRYGHVIRMRCKYAAEAATILERMRAAHAPVIIDEDDAEAEVEAEEKREREERALRREASHAVSHKSKASRFGRRRTHEVDEIAVAAPAPAESGVLGSPVLSDEEQTVAGAVTDEEGATEKKVEQ